MLRGNQERPIPGAAEGIDAQKAAWYCDTIALDSPYDYDPFWQRCVELGVAVTQHSGSGRWQDRASISNFTYNHVGHFAEANHAFARGVFLGGLVGRRYPSLNFGFMEGGVSWASQMCNEIIRHWEKRRRSGWQYPSATSVAEMHQLIDRYGDQRLKANADAIMNSLDAFRPSAVLKNSGVLSMSRTILKQQELIQKRMSGRSSPGTSTSAARRTIGQPCGLSIPVWACGFGRSFSSDFTHFDVPDFREVIPKRLKWSRRSSWTGAGFSRVHVHQRRAAAHAQQPGLLQGHRRRASGGQ